MWKFWILRFASLLQRNQASGKAIRFPGSICVNHLWYRTVIVPDAPGIALKLALGVRISSALRTISHFTADFGPRFSADVVPKLAVDPTILHVERETSSAVFSSPDAELSKHLTAVIREEYQPPFGEVVIVVAALLEYHHSESPPGVSAVQEAFQLYTREKRINFLDRSVSVSHCMFLSDLLHQIHSNCVRSIDPCSDSKRCCL